MLTMVDLHNFSWIVKRVLSHYIAVGLRFKNENVQRLDEKPTQSTLAIIMMFESNVHKASLHKLTSLFLRDVNDEFLLVKWFDKVLNLKVQHFKQAMCMALCWFTHWIYYKQQHKENMYINFITMPLFYILRCKMTTENCFRLITTHPFSPLLLLLLLKLH